MYSDAVYCIVSVNINPECCFSGAHIAFADRHVFPDNKYHGVEPRLLKSALLRDKRYVCCENTVMYQSDHTLAVLLYSLTFSRVSSALVLMLVMLQLVTSIVHTISIIMELTLYDIAVNFTKYTIYCATKHWCGVAPKFHVR